MDVIDIGRQDGSAKRKRRHIPSVVQPDTLFHFVSKFEYLLNILKHKKVSPRYCKEDFRFLKLGAVKDLAFPMSCFCNIGLQRLGSHMECYGSFGVAFPKEWCMKKSFQPVHYLNEESPLAKDARAAFKAAQKTLVRDALGEEEALANYLLHQLMYFKPYQGSTIYRVDGARHRRCFADECEWRYVPDLSSSDMPMVISEDWKINSYILGYNEALERIEGASIKFEYYDLKYVMVGDSSEYMRLLAEIDGWRKSDRITQDEANQLLSKVLIWDELKGDF